MYVAKRPCRLNGKNYRVGERIEDSDLQPYAAPRLQHLGYIYQVSEQMEIAPVDGVVVLDIPILNDEDGTVLRLPVEELQSFFKVMQMRADEAKAYIRQIESPALLSLITLFDSRKAVKAEASEKSASIGVEE